MPPGKRRSDGTKAHELQPGDYVTLSGPINRPDSSSKAPTGSVRALWLCSPRGELGMITDDSWGITVEDDGTVTVSPSIWWNKPTGWHGFLERGVWREA